MAAGRSERYGACGDDARACRSLSGPPPKPSAAGSVGRRSRSGASEACSKGGTRDTELAATQAALRRFPHKKSKLFQNNRLTNHLPSVILVCARCGCRYGGVAQLARAFGSYPECHWFESSRRYQFGKHRKMLSFIWPVGQVVKTPPFHGGNTSSSLVRVTRRLSSAG